MNNGHVLEFLSSMLSFSSFLSKERLEFSLFQLGQYGMKETIRVYLKVWVQKLKALVIRPRTVLKNIKLLMIVKIYTAGEKSLIWCKFGKLLLSIALSLMLMMLLSTLVVAKVVLLSSQTRMAYFSGDN